MDMALRLTPRKGDLLAVTLIMVLTFALSLVLWTRAQAAPYTSVEIYQNGEKIQEVSLNTDQTFSLTGGYTNTVTVRDGKIAITHSTCPGADCVHSGWAHRAGQAIVCLPNKTEIRLIGVKTADSVDAIAG